MTAASGRDGGPVDRYLDEMFNRLVGTGANGRRLLIEAEEHLTEAAAEGRARGLDAEAAEREAVDRFGAAATVARRLPASSLTVRVFLRRLATGAWALTGTVLAWYGLTGALTWLLSGPWARLLIATDRFGAHPMCERPWIPEVPIDCVSYYRLDVSFLPGADNDFPYLLTAGLGVLVIVALLFARRTTPLGAPSWTPTRTAAGWPFAVLFGLGGAALLVEAVDGIGKDVQYYVLTDIVAGLLALVIGAVALWWASRRDR
ncbi:hypothetical protein [Paractinoplanes toevensis]|uniref:Uncharacterized protein n=1 Tax=Paractinoplanes toevensis TaxID=571911 RepID=A0A919W3B8_9ACTN|nr:hypothetical protein [Actinoplanes toevensis]GIM90365.1 hypothetical protein Ato02nite_021580 [Actinoplanes toevensis]